MVAVHRERCLCVKAAYSIHRKGDDYGGGGGSGGGIGDDGGDRSGGRVEDWCPAATALAIVVLVGRSGGRFLCLNRF